VFFDKGSLLSLQFYKKFDLNEWPGEIRKAIYCPAMVDVINFASWLSNACVWTLSP